MKPVRLTGLPMLATALLILLRATSGAAVMLAEPDPYVLPGAEDGPAGGTRVTFYPSSILRAAQYHRSWPTSWTSSAITT